jgi:hypothetical protein
MVEIETDYLKLERKSVINEILDDYEKQFVESNKFYDMTKLTHTLAILNNRKSQQNDHDATKRITLEIKHHTNELGEIAGNNFWSLGVGTGKVVALTLGLDSTLEPYTKVFTGTFDLSDRILGNKKEQQSQYIRYHKDTKENFNQNNSYDKRQESDRIQAAFQRAQSTDQKENETKQGMLRQ